jgi:hypothetical protein
VRELVGHVVDAERVVAYRAMCAARGETAALPSFDEDAWVAGADFEARTLASLMGELTAGAPRDARALPPPRRPGARPARGGQRGAGDGAGRWRGSSPATSCTTGGCSKSGTDSRPSRGSARTAEGARTVAVRAPSRARAPLGARQPPVTQ